MSFEEKPEYHEDIPTSQNGFKFELGKYYQHTNGSKLHVCGVLSTDNFGLCFAGEDIHGDIYAIGTTSDYAVDFNEISQDEFLDELVFEESGGGE